MMNFLEVHHLILMIYMDISLQNSMTDVLEVQRIFAYNKKEIRSHLDSGNKITFDSYDRYV